MNYLEPIYPHGRYYRLIHNLVGHVVPAMPVRRLQRSKSHSKGSVHSIWLLCTNTPSPKGSLPVSSLLTEVDSYKDSFIRWLSTQRAHWLLLVFRMLASLLWFGLLWWKWAPPSPWDHYPSHHQKRIWIALRIASSTGYRHSVRTDYC